MGGSDVRDKVTREEKQTKDLVELTQVKEEINQASSQHSSCMIDGPNPCQVKHEIQRLQMMRGISNARDAERFKNNSVSVSFVFLLVAILVYQNRNYLWKTLNDML